MAPSYPEPSTNCEVCGGSEEAGDPELMYCADCGMGMCGVCVWDHEAQGKCAEEVCRRKVDAAENRDTRREEEALVTAVAVTALVPTVEFVRYKYNTQQTK